MEYCDLKKIRETGESKVCLLLSRPCRPLTGHCTSKELKVLPSYHFTLQGYCFVNYSTPEAAAHAVEHFNMSEFPPQSGHRIKVMFADPMGTKQQQQQRSSGSGTGTGRSSPCISMNTTSTPSPSRNMSSPDMVNGVQDSLAGMTMQRNAPTSGNQDPRTNRLATPVSSSSEWHAYLFHNYP